MDSTVTLSDFSIQDEATTVSRAAEAATATTNHTGTATAIHPATDGEANHAATDHQSAERSVAMKRVMIVFFIYRTGRARGRSYKIYHVRIYKILLHFYALKNS